MDDAHHHGTEQLNYTPDVIALAARHLVAPPWTGPAPSAWLGPAPTRVGPMYTHRSDKIIGGNLRNGGAWEDDEYAHIAGRVGPGMRVVDVGANIGYFTRLMAKLVGPEGSVVAVEPVPDTRALLQANLALGGVTTVTTLAMAAGNESGTVTMVAPNAYNGGAHQAFGRGVNKGTAVIHRLDDVLCPEARIDFIKIDAQGFDIDVLHGAIALIRQWRPAILFELEARLLRDRGIDPALALASLASIGIEVAIAPWSLIQLRAADAGERLPRALLATGAVRGHEGALADFARDLTVMLVAGPRGK